MSVRSPIGAFTSDLPENRSFCSYTPAVDISKWREDIQEPAASNLDFMFKSDFSAASAFDAFEPKDTSSEHSMDSAYQSQTGRSQRGTTKPDEDQWMPAYDFSAMHNQFPGSNLTSPILGPENSTSFSETANFHHTPHGEGLEAWNTDMSAEQVLFTPYSSTTTAQNGLPLDPYEMGFSSWDATTAPLAPFVSYDNQQEATASMFDLQALSQPQGVSMVGASTLTAVRNSPSFATAHDLRRASAQSASMSTYVASPPATTHTHRHDDFAQHLARHKNKQEQESRPFLPTPSLNEDEEDEKDDDGVLESLSPGEAKKYEEERTKSARTDPLYLTLPGVDGLYACPFQSETNCSHKKTNLKCNFDKFLDSHIKPFRCKREKCDDVKFSSTACLLRHERENHGMHGHGDRPHLCYYQECDRSRAGHGFPRRYNAFDHMKRVHGWNPENPNPSSPPRDGPAPVTRKVAGRKRKSVAEDGPPRRKVRVSEPKPTELSRQEMLEQKRNQFHQDFSSKKQTLIDMLSAFNSPNDFEKATKDQLEQTMKEMFSMAAAHKDCSG